MRRRLPTSIWLPQINNSIDGLRNKIREVKNSNVKQSTKEILLKELGQYYGGLYTRKYEFSPL